MNPTDAELLRRSGTGDPDAFALFFRRHELAVERFVARRAANPSDVPDVVADVFFAALTAAHRYEPRSDSALPWLYGIGQRKLQGRSRRLARHMRALTRLHAWDGHGVELEAERVARAQDANREVAALREAIDRLPRGEREVLGLVALGDLTPTEAAAALGMSPNAARIRLTRARKRLAEHNLDPGEPTCLPTT